MNVKMMRPSICLFVILGIIIGGGLSASAAQDYILTVAVLVNSNNPAGYKPDSTNPGEFQKYPERYLDHLQVPYEIFDVALESPPLDLADRQLILIGHRGVNLSPSWQSAIIEAVAGGTGLVNLDWDRTIGNTNYVRTIFGASGSYAGVLASYISVPSDVLTGGSNPHYIASMQMKFLGDPPGDIIYNFHPDQDGVVQKAASTVLTNTNGTIIAKIGENPLIVSLTYGLGRAVHFGTLEYLKSDRFGFLMGLDDLFWRSLVWASRKPFVIRGYPRFWTVQMDDTYPDWGYRVRDMYDINLTGELGFDGTGGPWKVTGYVFTDNLAPGITERASVIKDINSGYLEVSPHSRRSDPGSYYWQTVNGSLLNDNNWPLNVADIQSWIFGNGGSDKIPSISRSMVPHTWSLSDVTGYELWNVLGFRYITEIQRPGVHFWNKTDADRLRIGPFRLYELTPFHSDKLDESYPIFISDFLTVNSRSGFPAQSFFSFATQVIDYSKTQRPDLHWPNDYRIPEETIDQFKYYTWRLWSGLAPVQIYTHDASTNYSLSSPEDRQRVIRETSQWLNLRGVRHVHMDELGDYMYARKMSSLVQAQFDSNNEEISYSFTGNTNTPDGAPVNTELLVFLGDVEGISQTIPSFNNGTTINLPMPSFDPLIIVNPTSLAFTATTVDGNPPLKTVSVLNGGVGSVVWHAERDVNWINLSPLTGTAPSLINVSVDTGGLGIGTYNGTITISDPAATNSPQTINVTMVIREPIPPVILLSPYSFNFTASVDGDNPMPQSIGITNGGDGSLNWAASGNRNWISVSPGSGTAPATVNVGVDISGLSAGEYSGVVTISDSEATNSPQSVPVSLKISSPPPPTITGITPIIGSTDGGTTVLVTGSGFVTGTTLTIGGNHASNIVINGTDSISAIAPPGISGVADIVVDNGNGRTTLIGGYTYVDPGSDIFSDNFNDGDADGWNISPLGYSTYWSTANGAYTYSGDGLTQVFTGNDSWNDYTFGVSFRLSTLNNYPGGIRARLNTVTGAGYAVWLYPESSEIKLWRATGWNIDSPGLTQLGSAIGISFDTSKFHRLVISLIGSSIEVYYDGNLVISAVDSQYGSGAVALEGENQKISFDDARVTFGSFTALEPTIGLSIHTLDFSANEGEANPAPQSVSIANIGESVLNWTVSSDSGWLKGTPINGVAPSTVDVSVDIAGLVNGSYNGILTVSDPAASNSPQVISVTLELGPPVPPTIGYIAPANGTTEGGTPIEVKGSGFVLGTSVSIGGIIALDLIIHDNTFITAVAPANSAGPADVIVSNENGAATLTGAFTYIVPGSLLLSDSFDDGNTDGWTASPLGHAAGWNVVDGVYSYDGSGHTQSYHGDAAWTDYSLMVGFRLQTLYNYPGGIRGRVNPATGEGYAVWLYPANGQIKLFRTTAWNIDSPGLTQVGVAGGIVFDTVNFHDLLLSFNGPVIEVYYDGALIITATDVAYGNGVIALDVSNQPIEFDNVRVTFGKYQGQPALTSIEANPSIVALNDIGSTQQLQIIGIYNDESTQDLTNDPLTTYISDNIAVAVVSTSGLITANGGGDAVITMQNSGIGTTVPVSVRLLPQPPTISEIIPVIGSAAGGTSVEINGTGFVDGTTITIGGGSVTDVVIISSSLLTAVTPAGLTGPADVTVSNANGSDTLVDGFTYLTPGGVLMSDDFEDGTADGWTISPLGHAAGWSVVDGVYSYDGSGHTQSYRGDAAWTDYTLMVGFRLQTLKNYPGGIRGRVNPATGAGYEVWLRPADGQIRLYRVTGWSIDSPGSTQLGVAGGIVFDTVNFHDLFLIFNGSVIEVYYDGALIITATDAAYGSGAIALDVSNQPIEFDNIEVIFQTALPVKISSISPNSGVEVGGTLVEIAGSSFVDDTTVTIGGVAATDVIVGSSTMLTAVTPPGLEGPADVVVENVNGSYTLIGGFTYVAGSSTLMHDDFSDDIADGWTISPLGHAAGWSVVDGVYSYDGSGHTQSYRGDAAWTDYTLMVGFRLQTLKNYPGGIRGRVNPATGAGYEVWLRPADGQIRLYRVTGWSIDSRGLKQIGMAGGIGFDTVKFHDLSLSFNGSVIEVYYDGALVITAIDATYSRGLIALDVSNKPIMFDDVTVLSE